MLVFMIRASVSSRNCRDTNDRTFGHTPRASVCQSDSQLAARCSVRWGIEIVFGLAHINVNWLQPFQQPTTAEQDPHHSTRRLSVLCLTNSVWKQTKRTVQALILFLYTRIRKRKGITAGLCLAFIYKINSSAYSLLVIYKCKHTHYSC